MEPGRSPLTLDEVVAIRQYHLAVERALARLRESERLCAEIDAVVARRI